MTIGKVLVISTYIAKKWRSWHWHKGTSVSLQEMLSQWVSNYLRMQKIGIRHTELLSLHLRLQSALSCSLQSFFLSTSSSKAEVHICQKAALKENERRIYCPALQLVELNSLYNLPKWIGDRAVHIDSGPLSRKKKCQNQKQFRLRLIWKQLWGALNRFAIMALISKWVADHQWYTLNESSEIINYCSALGLFTILTLISSQREEK